MKIEPATDCLKSDGLTTRPPIHLVLEVAADLHGHELVALRRIPRPYIAQLYAFFR